MTGDRPTTPRRRRQRTPFPMPSEFPFSNHHHEGDEGGGGLPSAFDSPSVHWEDAAARAASVFPPGIQVPSPPSFQHHYHHHEEEEETTPHHHKPHRPRHRGNPFSSSPSPSPSPQQQQQQPQPPPPPLTIMARVRAFLGPSTGGGEEAAYISVVARNRLVVVDPSAFGGGAAPDVVIGLAAAVNKLAAEEAGELAASAESQGWARAFELDRAFWCVRAVNEE